MGVYIKGMEMPTSCSKCKLFGEYGCPFIGAVGYALTRNERNDDCPLISVPPHGRLIDADALMKILSKVIDINASIEQRNEATDQERRCLWWFEQQIGIAPTIIPASFENLPKNARYSQDNPAEEGE